MIGLPSATIAIKTEGIEERFNVCHSSRFGCAVVCMHFSRAARRCATSASDVGSARARAGDIDDNLPADRRADSIVLLPGQKISRSVVCENECLALFLFWEQ